MDKLISNSTKVGFTTDLNIIARVKPAYKFRQGKSQAVYFLGKKLDVQVPRQMFNTNAMLTVFSPNNLRQKTPAIYKKSTSNIVTFSPIHDTKRLELTPIKIGQNQHIYFMPSNDDHQIFIADPVDVPGADSPTAEDVLLIMYEKKPDAMPSALGQTTPMEIEEVAPVSLPDARVILYDVNQDEVKTIQIEEEQRLSFSENLEQEEVLEKPETIVNEPVVAEKLEDVVFSPKIEILTNDPTVPMSDLRKILLVGGGIGILVCLVLALVVFLPHIVEKKDNVKDTDLPTTVEHQVEETVIIDKLIVANNTTRNTSLRVQSNENSTMLSAIPNGDTVSVIKYASYYDVVDGVNGKWVYVSYKGQKGWCWGKHLSPINAPDTNN